MSPTYLITTPVEVDVLWKVKADNEEAAIKNLSEHCADLKNPGRNHNPLFSKRHRLSRVARRNAGYPADVDPVCF